MPGTAESDAGVALLRGAIRDAKHSRPSRPVVAGVALELFSGSSRLSCALRKQGVPTVAVDIKQSALLDVTRPALLNYILRLVSCKAVSFVWLGTPCSTWSLARRGHAGRPGGPLRTLQHILGHPEALARPADRQKIMLGNSTMRASAAISRCCLAHGVACGLENPNNSRIFKAPAVRTLCAKPVASVHVCDFCQFGSPFRKRTRVVLWLTGECSSIRQVCSGRFGCCSRTGRPHQIIRGNAADGRL